MNASRYPDDCYLGFPPDWKMFPERKLERCCVCDCEVQISTGEPPNGPLPIICIECMSERNAME